MFSQYQNSLLVDCHYTCWWILSGWFPGHKVSPSDAICHWYLLSRFWLIVWFWVSALVCFCPTILRVSISCRQCWPYKGLWRLALFVGHPKNGGAEIGRKSHRQELGADVMGGRIESWTLLSWHWLVNFANNKEFGHSQFWAHPPHLNFSTETSTKHLQLHLLCPGGSQFQNSIERALGPNGPV